MTKVLDWAKRHPMIMAWVGLAVGMVAILLYTAKDAGLLPSQMLALAVATVALAGACVWILTWDSGEEPSGQADDQAK